MAEFYRTLTPELIGFIEAQKLFFTASAGPNGRVNLSPKGYDSLRVLSPVRLAYVDFPGSGNETANHLAVDGRLTLMWCSFGRRPLVLRVYCLGQTVEPGSAAFPEIIRSHFSHFDPGIIRRIIVADVESAQTTCGWGVPLFEYVGERSSLREWAQHKRAAGELEAYIQAHAAPTEEKFPVIDPRAERHAELEPGPAQAASDR
ncbi:MAG TPA: pyridoxamine 5'-phosphate oxidase family protein [Limnochordia bacterium]